MTMYAIRIEAVIPKNRQLAITVPAEVPVGKAEVIILSEPVTPQDNGRALLRHLRQRHLAPEHRRSAVEIDAYVQQERNAWD
jgi:hypothetical protein